MGRVETSEYFGELFFFLTQTMLLRVRQVPARKRHSRPRVFNYQDAFHRWSGEWVQPATTGPFDMAGAVATYLTLSSASAANAYNRASVMLSTQPSMLTTRPAR